MTEVLLPMKKRPYVMLFDEEEEKEEARVVLPDVPVAWHVGGYKTGKPINVLVYGVFNMYSPIDELVYPIVVAECNQHVFMVPRYYATGVSERVRRFTDESLDGFKWRPGTVLKMERDPDATRCSKKAVDVCVQHQLIINGANWYIVLRKEDVKEDAPQDSWWRAYDIRPEEDGGLFQKKIR